MDLMNIIKFGYGLVIGTFILMIWISIVESKETEMVRYPPCYFNSLCSCSKSEPDLGIVSCRDVHLPKIPDSVNISKVFVLHLHNNHLRTIQPFFLQSTGLYKIVISQNPLAVIADEGFLGLERSLWELELSFCQLTTVPNRALRYLQKLRLLDLTGNEINKILPEDWRGLENSLEVLILAENSLIHLPIDSFSGLPMLDTIDLRGNNLREIDPNVFRDGMGRLAHLILADNQLTSIPYQALQPLRVLKTLDLSYNQINRMEPPAGPGTIINLNFQLNLDVFKMDYNQLTVLKTASFQYFNVVNKTYLDGNPLSEVEGNAFRQAKIRELYIRSCGLTGISPEAFGGLENYLELLDLSGNNISLLPENVFHHFGALRSISLRDNIITRLKPTESFIGFQFTLYKLDISGSQNVAINIQDLKRLRSLRFLSLAKLNKRDLYADDFIDFGIDLEDLQINGGGLQTIKGNAFKFVHGLKRLDLSENSISTIDNNAFADISHSLIHLKLSRALSSSIQNVPSEAIKSLSSLEELDLSNNHLRNVPDTAFHFLKKLRKIELQDNMIDIVHKGTFQGDIHSNLELIFFSFNNIRQIQQHTFNHLLQLEQLHLDDNRIESIERRSFMNLQRLRRLNLKGNRITTVSYEAFQNLPELEDLDMSYNRLNRFEFSFFDQVGTLSILHVNVSHNKLLDLVVNVPLSYENEPGGNGFHSNIRVLDMSFNNISTISKRYFRPIEVSLTHLYLSHNQILNATRDVFGNMPHLQLLDLSYNGLYDMDFDTFRNTKRLQVLLASNNRITDIPIDIFRFLNHLRIVDLSHNRLRMLPDNLFREEGLERLDVSHNMLSKLPLTSMSISTAMTLCELDLSSNSISSLAHGGLLARFKSLNFLDLSYNRIVQIDAGTFKNLPRLLTLDLGHNPQLSLEANGLSFQGLEYSLLHLNLDNVSLTLMPTLPVPHLVSLSMAYNALPTVSVESAVNMSALTRLNLNYNDLTAIPIITHSLTELRHLSMMANPITFLSNTSLLGLANHLIELDIRNFNLNTVESGAFCKLYSLKTLKLSLYRELKFFNLPALLRNNAGLRNLEIYIDKETDKNLDKELQGELPPKLRNITFSGKGLKKLGLNILQGIHSPKLHISITNTSILKIPTAIFQNIGLAKNLTVDVRNNDALQNFLNPSTGSKPNLYRKTFLFDLKISGNKWTCDCDLGWIEVWQRKKRQYLCGESSSSASFTNPEYTCRHTDDDLRIAACANKNNQSVIEVLKADIECGWSSATYFDKFPYGATIIVALGLLTI